MQTQKPMLYHNGCLSTKRNKTKINLAMGAFYLPMIGILLMGRWRSLFDIRYTGLYRDNGEILFRETSPRNINPPRKELIKYFKSYGLKANTITNAKVINLLMTLNLITRNLKPYTKYLHNLI